MENGSVTVGGQVDLQTGTLSDVTMIQNGSSSFAIDGSNNLYLSGGSITTNTTDNTDGAVTLSSDGLASIGGPRPVIDSTAEPITIGSGTDDAANFGGNVGYELEAPDFDLSSGTTTLQYGTLVQTSGTTDLASADTLSATAYQLTGGTLDGTGTLEASLTNTSGTIAPGDAPGILTIDGNYTQGPDGVLQIADDGPGTAGTSFSQLDVDGSASLGGALAMVPSSGYASSAAPGDSVEVLTATSTPSGTFGSVTSNPSLTSGESYTADYSTPDQVDAVVGSGSSPAPTVSSASPSAGPAAGGSSVTITGTGFTTGSTVSFGTNPASDVDVLSSTSITATSPAGTGTVDVEVSNANGTSAANAGDQFTYNGPTPGCTAPSDSYATEVLSDSPLVYYPLDERSGTTMCDASGNGNDGTYASSGVGYGVSGPLGSDSSETGVSGDGSASDLLGAGPGLSGLSGNQSFTLEGWFKGSSSSPNEVLVALTGGSNDGLAIWKGHCDSGTDVYIALDEYGASNCWDAQSIAGIDLQDGSWHYLAITYDASASSDQLSAYVDGHDLGAQTISNQINWSDPPVRVGNWVDTDVNQPFTGDAAQIAVYGTALSTARIDAHYQAASPPPAAPTITGVSPNAGSTAGGGSVTITGTNFTSDSTVKFGANPATGVDVISSTSITATVPAGSAGTVDVRVTAGGGTSPANPPADQFTYTVPDSTHPPSLAIHSGTPVAPERPVTVTGLAGLAGDHVLVLREHGKLVATEVSCGAAASKRCHLRGTLSERLLGRRRILSSFTTSIPGGRISSMTIHFNKLSSLHIDSSVKARLQITSTVAGTRPVSSVATVTLVPASSGRSPQVSTEDAVLISPPLLSSGQEGSATLTGIVNAEGQAATYEFEIGPADGDWTTIVPADGGSVKDGSIADLVTATIQLPAFAPPVIYYRVVATNDAGTTDGALRKFVVTPTGFSQLPAPLGDVTGAGPDDLTLTDSCVPGGGPVLVTGGQITCVITAFNNQPVALGSVAVRPSEVILDAPAPPGTLVAQTLGPNEAIPMSIAPQTEQSGTVSFVIMHPPGPDLAFTVYSDSAQATSPALQLLTPQASISSSCVNASTGKATGPVPPGGEIRCTVITTVGGGDDLDFTSFELQPSSGLTDGTTTSGGPPVTLGSESPNGIFSTTTVTYQVSQKTRGGQHLSLSVIAIGQAETTGAPVPVLAQSNTLTAGGGK